MKILTSKHIWKIGALMVVDGVMFGLTNAGSIASIGLIIGFGLLALTFYYLMGAVLAFVRLYGLSIKRKRRMAAVLTGLFSGLVALQSIGELNSRDVLVLVPLMFIGYIYSSYGKSTRVLADTSGAFNS